MTVAALIEIVLRRIAQDFYGDRDRDFLRDRIALTKAIARYGFECNSRNWQFAANDICNDLLALLGKIRSQKLEIDYLPVYLEGAVDRHIRLRADELNAKAKKITTITENAMGKVKPADVREATTVETLDQVYKDLKQRRKRRKKIAAAAPKIQQRDLL